MAFVNDQPAPANLRYQWQWSSDSLVWTDVISQGNAALNVESAFGEHFWLRYYTAGSVENFSNPLCRFFSLPAEVTIRPRDYVAFDTICGDTSLLFAGQATNQPGVYKLDLVNEFGCDSIVTLYLDTVPRATLSASILGQDPSCHDLIDGSLEARRIASSYPPYFVSLDMVDYPTTQAINLRAGQYAVRVSDRFGCLYDTSYVLDNPSPLEVRIIADSSNLLEDEQMVDLQTNFSPTSIEWSELLANFRDQTSFVFISLRNSTIQGQVSDENVCMANEIVNFDLDTQVSFCAPKCFFT